MKTRRVMPGKPGTTKPDAKSNTTQDHINLAEDAHAPA